jgi:two-component system response regulator YesN
MFDRGQNAEDLLSNLFFDIGRNNFNLKPLTLEYINNAFGMAMRHGIFRICHVRFDFFHHAVQDTGFILTMEDECLKIMRANMGELCYDTLFSRGFLQCSVLLNYPSGKEEQVRCALESCLVKIKQFLTAADTAAVTFGLSLPYRELGGTCQAIMETIEAVWLRFSKGTGRVIYWEKEQVFPSSYIKIFENYKQNLKKACLLLDIDTFLQTARGFFSLPKRILMCKETRALLYEVEQYMYEINEESILAFSDVTVIRKKIIDAHRKAGTLKEYLDCYVEHMASLFKQIIAQMSKNNKLVRQAQYFVEQNLGRTISLTDAAEQIGLNAVYFSHLFKKITGINFTDYVTARKITAAKTYLAQGNIKVGAVAALAGFSNEKYFSKKFKEKEGLTPGEYRKLHG